MPSRPPSPHATDLESAATYSTGTKKKQESEAAVEVDAVFGERTANSPNYTNTGWFRTSILMMKSQIGLGVLSIPFVFQTVGMIPGILILLALAIITTYTDYTVGTFKTRHPHVHSVADVGMLFFGPIGREIFGAMYWLYMTCIAGSGMLGIAISLNAISNHGACTVIFVVVGAIVTFLLSLIQTLDKLSWLGWVGLVSVMAAILTLAIAVTLTTPSLAPQTGPWSTEIHMFGSPTFAAASNAIATVVFAFGGTPAFFTINAEMRNKGDFTKALLTCQAFVTATYLTIGIVVYYYAGIYVASPALGTAGDLMKKVCYGLALPALVVGAVIYSHLPAKYIFVRALRGSPHLSSNTTVHWIVWIASVGFCVLFSYVIASAVPIFNNLIGLVGALFGSFVTITIYGGMWYYDNWNRRAVDKSLRYRLMAVWNAFVIVVGMYLMISGTYGSIVGIIADTAAGASTRPFSCADNSK